MSKAIFIPQGELPVMNLVDFNDNLDWIKKTIGCDYFDFAHAYALNGIRELENIDIIIDDEGCLKKDVKINLIGSILYGTPEHRIPLVGNCLIVANDPETGETLGLTDEQIALIANYIAV